MPIRSKPNINPATRALRTLQTREPGGRTHRSFVLYGRSASGKTTLSATWPKPALLIDIKDVGDDSVVGVKKLRVRDIVTWDDFEETYWYLESHPDEYKTIILDTVSQLQQLLLVKVAKLAGDKKDRAGNWGTVSQRQWGDVAAQMKSWITRFRDLPMHTVFIAQDRVFAGGDEEDGNNQIDPEVGPALSPSIAKHLNASVHFIGNTFIRRRILKMKPVKGKSEKVEKIDYCLRVGPNPVYMTKIRKPKTTLPPSVITNPTFDKILEIITGETNANQS